MHFSRHIICAILALATGLSASLCAEVKGPSFVGQHLTPAYRAPVEAVKTLADEDVVFLSGGLNQNFGEGMICVIERGDTIISEIILVKVDTAHSAALILVSFEDLRLSSEYSVRPGDIAHVKTSSYRPTSRPTR